MSATVLTKRQSPRPVQIDLVHTIETARSGMRESLRDYAAAQVDAGEMLVNVRQTLLQAHTEAAVLGRQRAGDFAAQDADDAMFAQITMANQEKYLRRFESDLTTGRYFDEQGNLDTDKIEQRLNMYTGRVEGTANETFVLASDPESLFSWVLGAPEEHCSDCPEYARLGPFRGDAIPAYPRDNSTPCKFHCRCHLVRDDGLSGFLPV